MREGFNVELDKAFQLAAIGAWDDVVKPDEPRSLRVEYLSSPETTLDYISVWSNNCRGRQDLVCDYWTWASSSHPAGTQFSNNFHSHKLAEALSFIMRNQDQFARAADACPHGLVVIHAPDEGDQAEASAWMEESRRITADFGSERDEMPISTLHGLQHGSRVVIEVMGVMPEAGRKEN